MSPYNVVVYLQILLNIYGVESSCIGLFQYLQKRKKNWPGKD